MFINFLVQIEAGPGNPLPETFIPLIPAISHLLEKPQGLLPGCRLGIGDDPQGCTEGYQVWSTIWQMSEPKKQDYVGTNWNRSWNWYKSQQISTFKSVQ